MKIIGLIGKIVVGIMATALLVAVILLGWFWFGDWQSRAVRDVEFVHETILAHHPGAVDPENPDFLVRMDDALARALPLARSARSPSDHRAALDAYTDVFADGHLTVATIADAPGAISRATANRDQMSGTAGVDIHGNSAWITISSFNERTAPIASITQSIEARAGTLRSLDRIVFDLRGNGGGDSAFGTRIARALWTAEVYRDWVPVSAGGGGGLACHRRQCRPCSWYRREACKPRTVRKRAILDPACRTARCRRGGGRGLCPPEFPHT